MLKEFQYYVLVFKKTFVIKTARLPVRKRRCLQTISLQSRQRVIQSGLLLMKINKKFNSTNGAKPGHFYKIMDDDTFV
jgi:hypothetical protein